MTRALLVTNVVEAAERQAASAPSKRTLPVTIGRHLITRGRRGEESNSSPRLLVPLN